MCPQLKCLIVSIYLFMLQASCDDESLPTRLQLAANNSMYLSWRAETGPLTSCSVVTPQGENVPLDPSLTGGRVVYSGAGVSQGVCGLRVDNVTSKDGGTWSLTAMGANNTRRTTSVVVSEAILEGPTRNITLNIDEYLQLQCGPEDSVLFCEIVSPSGESTIIRLNKCQKTVYPLEYRHAGAWKCRFLLNYQSFEGQSTTIVNINTDIRNFVVGQNETSTELNIFCSHPAKPIQLKSYCSILAPNGTERITLAPGRGLSRYKFFGYAPYHCGVSIRKPLKESEYGTWLCELVYTSGGHKGGYVHVLKGERKTPDIQPLQQRSSMKVVLSFRDKLAFTCAVPSSITYCWVLHPNGSVYSPNPTRAQVGFKYYGDGYDFGQCGIQMETPRTSDSGRWVCGMGLLTDDGLSAKELTTTVDVLVSDLPLAPNIQQVVARKGDTVTVGCGMVHTQAVTYCRFWKPDRTGLTVDRSTNTSIPGKYQYVGQGLHVGDCSLRVQGLQDEDFGSWICAATPIYIMQGGEITTTFDIVQEKQGISLAATFGILIGVAMIVGMATVVFVYKTRSRLKKKNSNDPLIPSTLLETVASGSSSGATDLDSPEPVVNVTKKRIIFKRHSPLS